VGRARKSMVSKLVSIQKDTDILVLLVYHVQPGMAVSSATTVSCAVVCDSKQQYTPTFWLILALNVTVNPEPNCTNPKPKPKP